MRILIAEDDPTSRMLLQATLQSLGHEVQAREDGKEAWEAYQARYFPVVLSDWRMPKIDGLDLCRKIREKPHPQYTNFILLTSFGGRENYFEAMEAGADDFLTKPYDEDQLAARLVVAERQLGLQKRMRQMENLLPVCAYCKRIRDQDDHWKPLEVYVSEHNKTQFSHTYCPECMKRYFPNL